MLLEWINTIILATIGTVVPIVIHKFNKQNKLFKKVGLYRVEIAKAEYEVQKSEHELLLEVATAVYNNKTNGELKEKIKLYKIAIKKSEKVKDQALRGLRNVYTREER